MAFNIRLLQRIPRGRLVFEFLPICPPSCLFAYVNVCRLGKVGGVGWGGVGWGGVWWAGVGCGGLG